MPVTFLVPAILGGLIAVVVPVLLHLRRRERERPMRFPSLMFLQQVTITTARRRRVTDWPLLLLRAAIIVLAVLAFARPVLRPRPNAAPARGTRRVVLALDRSMSMGHEAVWPAMRDSARAIIGALARGDRVAVIAFDESASVEQPLTTDHAAALAAIDRVRPGSRGTHFGAGIRAAREILTADAGLGGGEILAITDLQRSGAIGLAGLTLPAGLRVRAVNASPRPHANTAIVGASVQLVAGSSDGRRRLLVSAELASRGFTALRTVRVTMTLNGRPSGVRDVLLPADGTVRVVFDAVPLPVGVVRLTVTADHDSLPADDVFNVVVPAEEAEQVVLVVPPDLAPNETLYLEQALETGDDPTLRLVRHNAGTLDAAMLRDAAVVILYDVPLAVGARNAALTAWVHNGGGLIGVAGTRLARRGAAAGILPGAAHGMVDRTSDRGAVLGTALLEHPVFAPFRGGASAPLGGARFFRYPRIIPSTDAQIVAQFDDGLPALLERQEGSGHVLLTALPLDATSGDFPLQPTYLPFLRGLVLYASGKARVPLWRTAGDAWLVPATVHRPVVKAPSGQVFRPESERGMNALRLDEAGFYTVYEGQPSGDPVTVVAVNAPADESDLTQMNAGDLLVGVGQDTAPVSAQTAASLAEAEQRQQIWRALLLLIGVALVIETLMASRGWRGTAVRIIGGSPEGKAS